MMNFQRADFPADFLFAAATSSYQIEGHAQGGAGPTHWDSFAATPGNVHRADSGALACDHYHRYAQDFSLMQAAGFDGYRFSTSWARVLPEGRGQPNVEGLDFYDRLVDSMLAHHLKPMATLYHWELPAALADLGGWRNPDIAHWFADFTHLIMSRIGDRVFSAAPLNEPWCVAWLGHFTGDHAPGLRDIRATAHAMHHVLKAHGSAIGVMRALGMRNLGGVFNFEYVHPADDSAEAAQAAARYDQAYNHFFLSGVFKGTYPAAVLEGLEPHMPKGWQDDFALIGAPLDWCGLNYYTCKRVSHAPGAWPNWGASPGPLPKTQMGWEIYPEGLTHFLRMVHEGYTQGLPLYITENGMAHAGAPGEPDHARMAYLDAHLAAARDAMAAGVPLAGYTFWSLLDNYEWALGYDKRFGLVHVDFETFQRTPKASYHALAAALGGKRG